MDSSTTMRAFMTRSLRSPALYTIPIPKPSRDEILVKVAFVSLNPTDHKHASLSLPPSKVVGCDFSGTVASAPQKPCDLKQGDRIAGVVHGCKDSHSGAFAEYLVADPKMCFQVPENVTLEKACTLGVGWVSAAQVLQQRLFKDYPAAAAPAGERKDALLVYSAATNTGMHTIQQARVLYPSIYRIAVASSQHHARLRALGADACFDYHSDSIAKDVGGLGKNVTRAIDCHSEGSSTVLCANLMNPGGRIVRTLPPGMISGVVPKGVRANEWILSYTALGKPFWFLFKYYPASPGDHSIASKNLKQLTKFLSDGSVTCVRHRLVGGGLESGIGKGFEQMKAGRVRGEKLVVRVGGES